jgi:hypothetical protein
MGGEARLVDAKLAHSSNRLNVIFEQKELLEKQYGGAVSAMSPVSQINTKYTELLNSSKAKRASRALRSIKKAKQDTIGLNESSQNLSMSPDRTATKSVPGRRFQSTEPRAAGKSKNRGKMQQLVDKLHERVIDVQADGLGLGHPYTVDFSPSTTGGLSQIYS